MLEEYGIVVAGGLGPLKDKAFRVGHMGNVNRNDTLATLAAVEGALSKQNYKFTSGASIAAANSVLAR
jgi:aspartate aminotransferase-like enzyme